jgi:hypothetical protein
MVATLKGAPLKLAMAALRLFASVTSGRATRGIFPTGYAARLVATQRLPPDDAPARRWSQGRRIKMFEVVEMAALRPFARVQRALTDTRRHTNVELHFGPLLRGPTRRSATSSTILMRLPLRFVARAPGSSNRSLLLCPGATPA